MAYIDVTKGPIMRNVCRNICKKAEMKIFAPLSASFLPFAKIRSARHVDRVPGAISYATSLDGGKSITRAIGRGGP